MEGIKVQPQKTKGRRRFCCTVLKEKSVKNRKLKWTLLVMVVVKK